MVTRDTYQRCAVCGRPPSEPCCDLCHRAHDHVWQHPDWSIRSGGNRIVAAKQLHHGLRR